MSLDLDHLTLLSNQLAELQDSGAKLSGADQDFIASFERYIMDHQDGCADDHYSGFDYARDNDSEGLTSIARANQILNSHHAQTT